MAKTLNIDLIKALRLDPKGFWKNTIGKKTKDLIDEDMDEGTLQGEKEKASYKSRQYVKYKRRGMRSLRTGKKLEGYSSVASKYTKSVNMKLTGRTIVGLKPVSADQFGVVMSYDPKDKTKIRSNEALGRNIRTLNDRNQSIIVELIAEELMKNIDKVIPNKIRIEVG